MNMYTDAGHDNALYDEALSNETRIGTGVEGKKVGA